MEREFNGSDWSVTSDCYSIQGVVGVTVVKFVTVRTSAIGNPIF